MKYNIDSIVAERAGWNGNPLSFYSNPIALNALQAANQNAGTFISDINFIKYGRPRWIITNEMLSALQTLQVDFDGMDFRKIVYFKPSFALVFERTATLCGYPLRWIRVLRSNAQTTQHAEEVMGVHLNDVDDCLFFECDRGENAFTGEFSVDVPPAKNVTDYLNINFTCDWRTYLKVNKRDDFVENCVRIAVSAMLYYAARPECFTPTLLSSGDRQGFKDRNEMHMVYFPAVKNVYSPNSTHANSGQTKGHHFRGWVLRVLRAERFKRNPDGTCRTILVPPCEIHAELA